MITKIWTTSAWLGVLFKIYFFNIVEKYRISRTRK